MLSGQKDVDFIILSKLNDRDLLSVCITDKYANRLCNNEDFWRNRFITKYGVDYIKYNTLKTWKRFYLLIVKYLNGTNNWNKAMSSAAKSGHSDLASTPQVPPWLNIKAISSTSATCGACRCRRPSET